MHHNPAASAARNPRGESSITRHSLALSPIFRGQRRTDRARVCYCGSHLLRRRNQSTAEGLGLVLVVAGEFDQSDRGVSS